MCEIRLFSYNDLLTVTADQISTYVCNVSPMLKIFLYTVFNNIISQCLWRRLVWMDRPLNKARTHTHLS